MDILALLIVMVVLFTLDVWMHERRVRRWRRNDGGRG